MLSFKTFTVNPFQENSYLIVDENKNGVIIDPGFIDNQEKYLFKNFISENQINLEAIWLTHAHLDHLFGVSFVKEFYKIPIFMNRADENLIGISHIIAESYGLKTDPCPDPDFFVNEGDYLKISEKELFQVIECPGHSPGSICFYNQAESFLIGGDVLFKESIGRTDLPGGDYSQLEKSIKNKLYVLPNETIVLPGHGPSTTIGYEKINNQFVKA